MVKSLMSMVKRTIRIVKFAVRMIKVAMRIVNFEICANCLFPSFFQRLKFDWLISNN